MTRATLAQRSLAFLALLVAAGCSPRVVVDGVAPAEARRCDVALRAAGLDAAVERDEGEGALRVVVRGDDADYRSALQVLQEHGLPRREISGFGAGPASLIPSPVEERARYIKGLSSEVEALIESIDGVVSAEVLVSLPERRPFGQQGAPASASAVVAHAGDESPVAPDEVRAIVVSAVGSEIAAGDVAVLLKPVVRAGAGRPPVRYERDRAVELGFLGSVAALAALEAATVWLLRASRLRAAPATGREDEHESA